MAAKTIDILTGEYVKLHYEEASALRRIGACLIDWTLVYSMYIFIAMNFRVFNFLPDFLIVIIVVAPNLLVELITKGKTVGKMALGMRVINDKCESPDFYQLFLRWLIFPIDFGFFVGIITMFAKGQRLGDMAGGCRVVYSQSREHENVDPSEEFKYALRKNYKVNYPNAINLKKEEIDSINKTLHQKSYMHRTTVVAEKVAARLNAKRGDFQSSRQFLQKVVNDYNYLIQNNILLNAE